MPYRNRGLYLAGRPVAAFVALDGAFFPIPARHVALNNKLMIGSNGKLIRGRLTDAAHCSTPTADSHGGPPSSRPSPSAFTYPVRQDLSKMSSPNNSEALIGN
jgi:hypothetical protein